MVDADLTEMYKMTEDERTKLTSTLAMHYSPLPELADLAAAVPRRDDPPLNGTTAALAAPDAAA
jgi:hypothetical protein